MDPKELIAEQGGEEAAASYSHKRRWWDYVILAGAVGVFAWFAAYVKRPPLAINYGFAIVLTGILVLFLAAGAWALWKHTRFA